MNTINDVIIKTITVHSDQRGWLAELFRSDELPLTLLPRMSYMSLTKPGVVRGPHEHITQTDNFIFISGHWFVKLWDNRPNSYTFNNIMKFKITKPTQVIVPPNVIHAYANANAFSKGMVINMPNVLFKGIDKTQPPDEIRHESNPKFPILDIKCQHPLSKFMSLFTNV